MSYQMQTITQTRLRSDHNTAGSFILWIPAGTTVTGVELFTAPSMLSSAALGVYQSVGDKWLKVTYNGQVGWVAYIHKGEAICKNFVEITEPTPPAAPTFPTSYTLTDPQGNKAEYVFVKLL